MRIGVLALQGAFLEHERMLQACGVACFQIRNKQDLSAPMDGLILPGGESTVMGKLLREFDLLEELRLRILQGMPVMGTCAGAILLAKQIEQESAVHLATIPMQIQRNAYGRQLSSFTTTQDVLGIGSCELRFIRAPQITAIAPDVTILAQVQDAIVGVEYGNQLAFTFHPELSTSTSIHAYFIQKAQSYVKEQNIKKQE